MSDPVQADAGALAGLPTEQQFRDALVAFSNAVHMIATAGPQDNATALWENKAAARATLENMFAALLAAAQKGAEDTARLDGIERMLRPLPWGGVYALIESDGDSQFRITVQPSSGDAPFINEIGAGIRAALDAALAVNLNEPPHA